MASEREPDEDVVTLDVELEPTEPAETEEGSQDPLELLAAPARLIGRVLGGAAEVVGEALTPDDDTDASDDAEQEDE